MVESDRLSIFPTRNVVSVLDDEVHVMPMHLTANPQFFGRFQSSQVRVGRPEVDAHPGYELADVAIDGTMHAHCPGREMCGNRQGVGTRPQARANDDINLVKGSISQ